MYTSSSAISSCQSREIPPINEGILSAIGNTPLIRLRRVFPHSHFELYAKLEGLNPGGSMKDRPALCMIQNGMRTGAIRDGTTIIESSSGNLGIGLAQACRYYDLRFICVVDPKTTAQNIRLLEAYGAEINMVEKPDPVTGEYLAARLDRVRQLLMTVNNSFWPNQYANIYNPRAHYQTMAEILAALDGELDYFFCATSTCGTLRGCTEYLRLHPPVRSRIIAVDAVGSVIFGGPNAKRIIPGHGASVVPPLFQPDLADRCIRLTDEECVIGCRRLLAREALLCGGSSGAVVMAIERIKHEIPENSRCVAILPDRGERYLSTIYSDDWTTSHFGDLSQHWKDVGEESLCETVKS